MARKITQTAVNHFYSRQSFNSSNTSVELSHMTDSWTLKLHGNAIAKFHKTLGLCICDGGYGLSVTTKERLNGLCGVQVNTRKGTDYLNGQEWDGEWFSLDHKVSLAAVPAYVETSHVRAFVAEGKMDEAFASALSIEDEGDQRMMVEYVQAHR